VVYVPDDKGNLYAVNAATHAINWQKNLTDYGAPPGDYSRATPAISGNTLVFGDQAGKVFSPDGWVFAVDKRNGTLLWKHKVEGGFPLITQSPTIVNNTVYIGVASYQELLVRFGVPLTFRGSFMALNLADGSLKWKTFMTPPGYTGAAVWGSSPSVDTKRRTVYISTGNNYSIPDSATACVTSATSDEQRAACIPADNMFDSIVALNMDTGAVKWATRALTVDSWNAACGLPLPGLEDPQPGCPTDAGPDYDFGQAPMLWKAGNKEFVGAGQKSGIFWALNPDTGAVVWKTQVGPGGLAGGLQWGSAVDGRNVYTANANSNAVPWTLPNGTTTTNGVWSGIDAVTGQLLWQTVPTFGGVPFGGNSSGPVTTANGVVFGCGLDPQGHMYALDGATGAILWTFASGGSCLSGAAIADGRLFWGSGYSFFGTPNNKLYSFGLPG